MIGVVSKPGQARAVEEFFELFKTPWELYRPGLAYDVVIVTTDEMPSVDVKLLVVCSPTAHSSDVRFGIVAGGRHRRGILSGHDVRIPILGELLTFREGSSGVVCLTAQSEIAGLRVGSCGSVAVRVGYDLFEEVRLLLSAGQPAECAHIPTLDVHISILRQWILDAGIAFVEIPAAPAGHGFAVCLTHDIDFVGIRRHRFDHSMWGFVYRATVGALRNRIRGRLAFGRLLRSWLAVASLPAVYAGWARDFWEPFEWYLNAENGFPATYFLIPFKGRTGENVVGPHASRRATAYDVSDLPRWAAVLLRAGCELGVHGIDAWHSAEKGRDELARVAELTGASRIGVRMHWLLRDANTPSVLERAGYAYDSTVGYNETVGYLAGTGQVFQPLEAHRLLELPLHIQDGALFYPQRLDLSEREAEERCQTLLDNASKFGGVLTVLWHDRSHGPERFWGGFYIKLLRSLRSLNGWFGTAMQVVSWFRHRREVRFERVEAATGAAVRLCYDGDEIRPPLRIRIYGRAERSDNGQAAITDLVDIPWDGKPIDALELRIPPRASTALADATPCSLS